MDNYLRRYVGTYRVKADYDLDTNDYPRDIDGNLDDSFGDFYIDCTNHIQIRHGTGSYLSCYIPSTGRGLNILRRIGKEKLGLNDKQVKDGDKLAEKLLRDNILNKIDILDGEVYFVFPTDMMEYIAKIVKPKTDGKNIQPLSTKNLPKVKSILSEKCQNEYKNITNKCSLEKLEKAQWIMKINKEFANTLPKNYKIEMKQLKLDLKGYIYHKGLWEKYISFISNNII